MGTTAACIIELPEQPMDCDCCPVAPLVAAGLVTGDVFLHRYGGPSALGSDDDSNGNGDGDGKKSSGGKKGKKGKADAAANTATGALAARQLHRRRGRGGASCRAVRFAADGASLICGYESGSLQVLDVETGQLIARLPAAHAAGVTRALCLSGAPPLVAAGDESGGLKLWDVREPGGSGNGSGGSSGGGRAPAMTYDDHTDFISGLCEHTGASGGAGGATLLVTSGDGTLSVHDLRKRKALARSEDDADDEMLSVVTLKHGKKVVVGCQSGVLSVFSWGYWADCSDRFPGHPESVDALVAFDEDTVISGSSDGLLRVLSVQPNKLLGIVGEYPDGSPVERVSLGWDHRAAASTSHEPAVRLWDLSALHDDDEGDDEEEDADKEEEDGGGEAAAAAAGAGGAEGGSGGGDGSSDGDSDSDDSDSDEDGGAKRKRWKKRERTRMTKHNNRPRGGGGGGGNFFADLL